MDIDKQTSSLSGAFYTIKYLKSLKLITLKNKNNNSNNKQLVFLLSLGLQLSIAMRTFIGDTSVVRRKPTVSVVLVRQFVCEYFEAFSFAVSERHNKLSHIIAQNFFSDILISFYFFFSLLTLTFISFYTLISTSASASFHILFSLPFMYLLRRSVNNFIVLLEHVTLRHLSFSIRHGLIGLILKLIHARSCQSRVLSKPFIKLFLFGASKIYLIQLLFGHIIKPLIQINRESVNFMLNYIERIDWNLSTLSMFSYWKFLVLSTIPNSD